MLMLHSNPLTLLVSCVVKIIVKPSAQRCLVDLDQQVWGGGRLKSYSCDAN